MNNKASFELNFALVIDDIPRVLVSLVLCCNRNFTLSLNQKGVAKCMRSL